MAKRRGRGEGSISQRPDGRWVARVSLGRHANGKRQRKAVYGDTRAAVGKKLNALLGRSSEGSLLSSTTPTLKLWLDDWFTTHKGDWRPSTRRIYRHAIDQWIVPGIGPVRLDALKPHTVQRWANGHTPKGPRRMLSTALVVLRSALQWAMTQRLITYNPATLVKMDAPVAARRAPLTLEQSQPLLEACEAHRLGGLIVVSLLLGLRVGEACGLTWADVDTAAGTLKVRQQIQSVTGLPNDLSELKTKHSRRTLTMPARVSTVLTARKKAQLEERLKAGDRWANPHDLVFTMPNGGLVSSWAARRVLAALVTVAGLPVIRYHTLRHTCATLLLADGTPLFDVSRILGHASIDITADLYGHLVPDMTAGAASRMDRLFAKK